MKRKVSYFITKDAFTGKRSKYAKIILYHEPTTVGSLTFKMNNIYNVPAEDIDNSNKYLQPLNNPNYNIKRAFRIYREKMGLLTPQQIKTARKSYHLSQRDVSAVIGMPYSTLSRIEDDKVVQSINQDTSLRILFNRKALAHLISIRLVAIKVKKPKRVKLQKLENIVKRIAVY